MIKIKSKADQIRLRRIALEAQGLSSAQPFGRGINGTLKAIKHIGYVQIDTISVVERAHFHVLYNRVPAFKPQMLDTLLRKGEIFEYWSHAAAFLPIEDFRFSLPYKHAIKNGKTHWHRNPDRKLMKELLMRIRLDGPLRSRDLETNRQQQNGWWDWKPAKIALEQLFMEGELMVSYREGFQKVYDLTGRVLPAGINTEYPGMAEFAQHVVEQQLRCHGIVTLKGLTYLRRQPALRQYVKALVDESLAQNSLEKIQLPDGESYLMPAGLFEGRLPRIKTSLQILSPFDNAVIQRDRLKSIFNFDYQIECYVPAKKRQFGYFSLPLLYGDAFIGRMDCKVHRKENLLQIKALHLEAHFKLNKKAITDFVSAVKDFAQFQQCQTVTLDKCEFAHAGRQLQKEIEALTVNTPTE